MLPNGTLMAQAAEQMTSSEELISSIKAFEGFRSQAYLSGGQWSIGYGTSASPGETVTQVEADQALRAHLHSLEQSLNRDRKSTRLNSSHRSLSRMPSSA